jgi:hypothetical protein
MDESIDLHTDNARSRVQRAVRRAIAFVGHVLRAVRILARDGRLPRTLRILVVLGALPIPGPVDEAVLLLSGGLVYAFYREPMREAWRRARLGADV